MTHDERNSLVAQIQAALNPQGRSGPIALPDILKPGAEGSPELKAQVRSAYAAAVMDTPAVHWTKEMREQVHAETLAVLKGMDR